jgi:hypothetical protein
MSAVVAIILFLEVQKYHKSIKKQQPAAECSLSKCSFIITFAPQWKK